jgi:hypothetical protein
MSMRRAAIYQGKERKAPVFIGTNILGGDMYRGRPQRRSHPHGQATLDSLSTLPDMPSAETAYGNRLTFHAGARVWREPPLTRQRFINDFIGFLPFGQSFLPPDDQSWESRTTETGMGPFVEVTGIQGIDNVESGFMFHSDGKPGEAPALFTKRGVRRERS